MRGPLAASMQGIPVPPLRARQCPARSAQRYDEDAPRNPFGHSRKMFVQRSRLSFVTAITRAPRAAWKRKNSSTYVTTICPERFGAEPAARTCWTFGPLLSTVPTAASHKHKHPEKLWLHLVQWCSRPKKRRPELGFHSLLRLGFLGIGIAKRNRECI